MSRMRELLLAALFILGGGAAALILKNNFESQMSVGGFTALILIWAVAVIALNRWMTQALKASTLRRELATAQRKERDWQNERALITLLEDKILAIFLICYMPTPESIPDTRYYPDFRKQLLLANKGRRNLSEMLRSKNVPAIPTIRGANKLTDEQMERLNAFVKRQPIVSV